MKLTIINCHTGCSCCSGEDDHTRGPYVDIEHAKRRVNRWLDPNGGFHPTASQYARRGRYEILEVEAEEISNNRWIIGGRVFDAKPLISVDLDGDIERQDPKDVEYRDEFLTLPYEGCL